MFGNISNMYKCKYLHQNVNVRKHSVLASPLRRKQYSRKLTIVPNATLTSSLTLTSLACSAKALSFIFTYPFETYKIYHQLNREPKSVHDLYNGFSTFIILATFQCFINYNFFFAIINTLKPYYPQHVTYLISSIVSCFLTSVIKVPLTFISRNMIFIKNKNTFEALRYLFTKINKEMYHKSWLTNLLSDIPDSFVKFFVNSWILINMPCVNNFNRSCITGLITSIVNMPFDYILTHTLCNNMVKSLHTKNNITVNMSRCMSGLQYRIMSCMLGNIIFFNTFNSLQLFYKVSV
jgi:uncharacterized membrane protein